jgi:hypothetical protein
VQPASLGGQPLLEARFAQREAVQQRAAVEPRRRLQIVEAVAPGARGELERIHPAPVRGDGGGLARGEQDALAQGAADRGQGLVQAVPRLGLGAVAPEQRRQSLARPWPATREGQHGEERRRLPRRKVEAGPVRGGQREAAQQSERRLSRSRPGRVHHARMPAPPGAVKSAEPPAFEGSLTTALMVA